MDEASIAKISQAVVSDTQFWIGLIGIIGAFVGSALTFFGTVVLHWIKARPQRDFDNQRIEILKEMLEDARFTDKWRKLSTLAAVIGASEQETKRLLIKTKARGSEKADGKSELIKNHPFPGTD